MRSLKFIFSTLFLLITLVFSSAVLSQEIIPNVWYEQGNRWLIDKVSELEQTRAEKQTTLPAKNIILFVGDGMSITTLTAARIWQGQQAGQSGEEHFLWFEHYPHTALIKTYNSNQQTPDSAGSMSAMMTGVKTRAGVISIGPEQNRSECAGSKQHHQQTLLEWGTEHDFATGIITTTRLTHPTPAATYAHSPERHWEGDWDRHFNAYWHGCDSIAKQLVEQAFPAGLDLALGGGASRLNGYFSSFQQQFPQGVLLKTASDLVALTAASNPVLGVFADEHLDYEIDRFDNAKNTQPSLTEMTEKAIQYFQRQQKNYVLVIEGGRIDHAHHNSNAARALSETVSFADAVKRADDMTDDSDTLIIVTADHSHTFMMTGYPKRGNPILSISVNQKNEVVMANDDLPFTTLGYANGAHYGRQFDQSFDKDSVKKIAEWTDSKDKNFHQGVATKLPLETHGSDDVALHAKGPGAYLFSGQMEQHEIFHTILQAVNKEMP